MGRIHKIKIFGERNSGTNYLHELINLNLNVELLRGVAPSRVQILEHITLGNETTRDGYFERTFSENLGWKHSRVDLTHMLDLGDRTKNIGFVCLVKNPYSWLLSFHQSPHHYEGTKFESFLKFVNSSLPVLVRDRIDADLVTPIELWNKKNHSYGELVEKFQGILVKYEELLDDPERTLKMIGEKFGIDCGNEFHNFEKSTKSNDGKNFNYYKNYYLNEEWKAELTSEVIDLINKKLNEEVMNKLGYSFL